MRHILATLTAISLLLVSCSRETVLREELPQIFPDYIGVTVPAGIAPLNFDLPEEYSKVFDELEYFIGEHVWAFADFKTKQGLTRIRGNRKGVFTKDRQPKMIAHYLKNRWNDK